jgi:hypothetical protein
VTTAAAGAMTAIAIAIGAGIGSVTMIASSRSRAVLSPRLSARANSRICRRF